MVKNHQKSQLLVGVSNNRPIIAKKREKHAKIFVKKSVEMGLISEKNMYGWVGFSISGPHTPVTSLVKCPPPPGVEWHLVELSWVKLSWVELSWVELSWWELYWVKLSWVEFSWLELSWMENPTPPFIPDPPFVYFEEMCRSPRLFQTPLIFRT